MAQCVFLDEQTSSYSISETELKSCGDSGETHVLMSVSEYTESTEIFNAEAYEIGHGGVISSWVLGLGIGFILAMLAKLKR